MRIRNLLSWKSKILYQKNMYNILFPQCIMDPTPTKYLLRG